MHTLKRAICISQRCKCTPPPPPPPPHTHTKTHTPGSQILFQTSKCAHEHHHSYKYLSYWLWKKTCFQLSQGYSGRDAKVLRGGQRVNIGG